MVEIFAKIGLINGIVALFLAGQIFFRTKLSKAKIAFIFLTFSIAFWSFGYWQWLSSTNEISAFVWVKLFTLGSIMIPLFYFCWVVCLLNLSSQFRRLLIFIAFVGFTLVLNTFFTTTVVSGLQQKLVFPYWPVPGFLYLFYVLALYLGLVFTGLVVLIREFFSSRDPLLRSQIAFVFWGSLIGFGGGISNFFLWYDILVPPYFNFLVSVGLIMFYYAASRARLFNIKVVATEFFVYLLWTAILIRLIFAATLQDYVIDGIVLVLVTIVGGLLTRSVQREVAVREQLEVLTRDLEAANKKLVALDKARAEFITLASHQLRTPPATMRWYLAAILDGDFGALSSELKDALSKTQATNNSLIALIEDLLNVSRIERGKLEFDFGPTDLLQITETTVTQLLPLAQLAKLKLVFKKPRRKLPSIIADKEKVRQVINNLIDNAIKYTKNGSITVELDSDARNVFVRVRDTGMGLKPEDKKSIFEKYGRGTNSRGQSMGLGLGLYVAKLIIAQHGGELGAESDGPDKGSIFY
ncbi:MAG: ATP-binding protein, partial [Patescibacteria group bacterium]|nr:ATP-binding protein [Patescibacteria group bacterium]